MKLYVGVDIGGGSTEIAIGADENLLQPARRYIEECNQRGSIFGELPEIKLTKYLNETNLMGALALAVADKV